MSRRAQPGPSVLGPVLPAVEDSVTDALVPAVIVIAPLLERALRVGLEAAAPGTLPLASMSLPLCTGVFRSRTYTITAVRDNDDNDAVRISLTCPGHPEEILRRSDNLHKALVEYFDEDDFTTNTKPDGTFEFTLPKEEYSKG